MQDFFHPQYDPLGIKQEKWSVGPDFPIDIDVQRA
jgi:hypothetical protein